MFCPNCGYNVADTERFCPNCGMMLQQEMTAMPVYGQPQKNKVDIKRFLPIIIGALVLVVALIIILVLVLGGGPKDTAVKFLEAEFTGDYATSDKYLAVTRKAELSYRAENSYEMTLDEYLEDRYDVDSIEEYYEENHYDRVDWIVDEYGANYKLTFDVQKSEKLDVKELKELVDEIEDEYDSELLDTDKVTEAYEVKVKCVVSGSEDSESETVDVTVIKLNGKWKVCSYS